MTIREEIEIRNTDAIFWDGFDEAIIGCDMKDDRVVYSFQKMIEIIMKQGISHVEAVEYLNHNVIFAYVGNYTPIVIDDFIYDPISIPPDIDQHLDDSGSN